jgi:hypothetical protein
MLASAAKGNGRYCAMARPCQLWLGDAGSA